MPPSKNDIQVIGAGPAGLVAAINLAQAGFAVTIHEAASRVGHRFNGDFQGIENWTTQDDVREFLISLRVHVNFRFEPYMGGIFFSPSSERREIRTRQPLFYLVERGGREGCLDFGLLRQAEAAGVRVVLNARNWQVDHAGVIGVGPRAADVIAKGIVFDTDIKDEAYAIVDDRIAPKGYAYLLTNQGRATLATVIYRDFRNESNYFEKTMETFRKLVPMQMRNVREFGGYGNYFLRPTAIEGKKLYLGESAGFQDALFGFGMRYAMASGFLAAQSIIHGTNYDDLWKQKLLPLLRTSLANRLIYELLRNSGYEFIFKRIATRADLRETLRKQYNRSLLKVGLFPVALFLGNVLKRMKIDDKSCHHENCRCVWCTHMKHGGDAFTACQAFSTETE
jgi:flavin-dependent dehydrogenase